MKDAKNTQGRDTQTDTHTDTHWEMIEWNFLTLKPYLDIKLLGSLGVLQLPSEIKLLGSLGVLQLPSEINEALLVFIWSILWGHHLTEPRSFHPQTHELLCATWRTLSTPKKTVRIPQV